MPIRSIPFQRNPFQGGCSCDLSPTDQLEILAWIGGIISAPIGGNRFIAGNSESEAAPHRGRLLCFVKTPPEYSL
jgi:hypothetical protein